MDLALPGNVTAERSHDREDLTVLPTPAGECRDEASRRGTAPGINIEPGSDDDGWIVPQAVELADRTRVQLYKDGEALHAAYEAIRRAKKRICLEVYIFAGDSTGQAFADLLAAKTREGIRVFVVYDAVGSMGGGVAMLRKVQQAGGNVVAFHPFWPWELKFGWRPFNRDHRKLLVIDDDIAGMGGLNVGANYAGDWVVRASKDLGGSLTGGEAVKGVGNALGTLLGGSQPPGAQGNVALSDPSCPPLESCDLWRDTAVGFRGPSAKLFLQAFSRTWYYVARGGRIGRAESMAQNKPGDLKVLASAPTVRSSVRPLLLDLMRSAKKSVEMTMAYFAPDDELVTELCRAARRGVRVRLMLPGRSDIRLLQIAARSFYERLMNNKVEIYERQSVVLHAKTMCIDGTVSIIGSTNLDYRSIEFNCELSSVIHSTQLGRQMHDMFENDVQYALRIDPHQWRRRPTFDRAVQWAVSRARYLL